ncbi:MAG TPA: SDR family oxidoreductase [Puia sp.]|jgi:NAD(P)-dependent dehydrogenase (short-subunit alcohol dehydrogenase family)|nr:SDR family oxidoreductase [Puia sp.]
MEGKFAGKVVWISGAAQGIGRGIAEHFAHHGAAVALADIQEEAGKALAAQIVDRGEVAAFSSCNVGKENDVRRSIAETAARFGGLHIIVNNAAINIIKDLHAVTSEEWDLQMDINLKAIFLSFKYAYPFFRQQQRSYIVNMGSVSSFVGQARTPGYIASKGAVLMLTKSIAIDYAPEGIRCNAVCPGITDTPLLREHVGSEELLQERLQRVPTGRILYPQDIARAVAWLSCEDSDGITGTSILIDGGYLATAEWNGGTTRKGGTTI